jgi:hypothetical protein
MVDGLPEKDCGAGSWFELPPNVPNGVRIASEGAVVLANHVVEKGKPPVTWL